MGQLVYLIYLLTAIGLTPGGSSTVHIYTQTVQYSTVQYTFTHKQYTERQKKQTIHRTTQKTNNTWNKKKTIPRTTQKKIEQQKQ
jgi:hypothetical protein